MISKIVDFQRFNIVNCGGAGDCQQKVLQYLLRLNEGTLQIKQRQISLLDNEEVRSELSKFTNELHEFDEYVPYIEKETLDKLWQRYKINPELGRGSEFWLLITASRVWDVVFEVHFLHNREYTRSLIFDWRVDRCKKVSVKEVVYDLHGLHYMAYDS